jgi:hypothetical protein
VVVGQLKTAIFATRAYPGRDALYDGGCEEIREEKQKDSIWLPMLRVWHAGIISGGLQDC